MHAIYARRAKSNVTDTAHAGIVPVATDPSNAITPPSADVDTDHLLVAMRTLLLNGKPRELQWLKPR